jgi:hypothetical protein
MTFGGRHPVRVVHARIVHDAVEGSERICLFSERKRLRPAGQISEEGCSLAKARSILCTSGGARVEDNIVPALD